MLRMLKLALLCIPLLSVAAADDLPSKKYLDLAAVKKMVAGAEAEAKKRNVDVTLCVVDENGTVIFLQKGDKTPVNTIAFAEKKAQHAAAYGTPSKDGADYVKKGNTEALAFPEFFPNQGGLPIIVEGRTIGGFAASGAKSEIDEAISQVAIDALLKK